jgi:hypothetical protein
MPLHVSGPFVAHHEEVVSVYVANGICFSSKVSVGRLTNIQLRRQTNAICHIYTYYLLMMGYKWA